MTVKVVLTRDSVCMGDDSFAPHRQDTTVDGATTLGDLVARVADYPLRMRGARWVVFLGPDRAGGSPIAEISPEWESPRFPAGVDRSLPLASLAAGDGELSLFFQYHPGSVPRVGPRDPGPTALDPLAGRLALWLVERR
ncbi:hypothetical protein ACIPYS_06555 [Kitasatospora sp. NPDC089913]|uniref:hypothetical protein n=1 Tax=Streptomycetaceae TaxID=2062 RepID=UPI00087A1293|nr:hypothetical protein [Streptomyces sp. TLI_053]SDT81438.1 hypothetical protein SAMN05216371_6644 [Streptomyces sp. TLI_053]